MKFSSNSRPLPLRRRIVTSPRSGNLFRKQKPTLLIGGSMFCLVIAYVVVVISVTRYHLSENRAATLADGSTISMSSSTASSSSLKQKLDQAKQEKDLKKKDDVKEKKQADASEHLSPREKRMKQFGRGVTPQLLVGHDEESNPFLQDEAPKSVDEHPSPDFVLQAFLEPLNFDEWEQKPLPIRAQAKEEKLQQVVYPHLHSCTKLPQQFPVDDTPTDADPFLPWIHDVFPTADGKFIQFVAQNKRRCKSGKKDTDIIMHMQPQISLMQHVPVQRVQKDGSTRYRLSTHQEADPDGITTRFICRFKPSMEETLSVFNFDYDWTNYRKTYRKGFQKEDGGIKSIHTSQILFKCPVPESLQETIRKGTSVKDDWATLFVDLIPIRTPPRWLHPQQFYPPWYRQHLTRDMSARFHPVKEWGTDHVLPRIEDSGRWENIPICKPSLMQYESQDESDVPAVAGTPQKKHRLVSCLWASAGYTTRGERFAVNDGQRRLLEWITYNKMIGFDHFYVYDNSGAFNNETSLKPIVDMFPGDVTYVYWPSQVCNNRPNNVDSPGERSSQYAAESSCRLRFGDHVDWIGQFDIDEYLVPMGKHSDVLSLIDELEAEDTRVISFPSWRAWPRWDFIEEPDPIVDKSYCESKLPCFDLRVPMKNTMLQTYNCDRQPPGQKSKQMPAEKQLYRPDYVLEHFVHYSAVTVLSEKNRTEYEKEGFKFGDRAFPDPRQRFADELKEGLMIHTKAVAHQDTAGWETVCHVDNLKLPKNRQGLCRLGVPWPKDPELAKLNATEAGWAYNCYVNEKVEEEFAPKLQKELSEKLHIFDIK